MKLGCSVLIALMTAAASTAAVAQGSSLILPKTTEAGAGFSIQTSGSGKGTLYIAGPGQVVKRDVELGQTVEFPSGTLYNAGRYMVVATGAATKETGTFDVVPAGQPAALSFLARPSRVSVGLQNGITGAVYVFDRFQNLITSPLPISFQLSEAQGATQSHTEMTRNGVAWVQMSSEAKEGSAQFLARAGGISSARIIQQVPGDPCNLRVSAKQQGNQLELTTDPLRDCAGNAVPDGTVVTFTETYNGGQSTVDVPIKRGIASVEMPAYNGAKISAATGVVLGNEIRWGRPQ